MSRHSLKARVAALEAILGDHVTLTMADGSQHKIRGGDHLMRLMGAAVHHIEHREISWIASCVSHDENGSSLVDLLKAFANGPVDSHGNQIPRPN